MHVLTCESGVAFCMAIVVFAPKMHFLGNCAFLLYMLSILF